MGSEHRKAMSLLTILIVLLVVAVAFGGWGHTQNWGYRGWSPVGVVVLILVLLWLTGRLR